MEKTFSSHQKIKKTFSCIFYILLAGIAFYSCKEDETNSSFDPNKPIKVNAIIPDSGTVAIPLVIHGENFGNDKSKIKVYFDDKEAVIISAQNEHLYVLNPKQTDGMHTVKVAVEQQEGALQKQFRYIVTSSVTTVAGSGEYEDIDGPALEAAFAGPEYLDIDDQGNILVSDYRRQRLKLVSLNDNKVTTLINGSQIYQGKFSNDFSHFYIAHQDDKQAVYDLFRSGNWAQGLIINSGVYEDYPAAMAIDDQDNLFILGYYGNFVKIDPRTNQFTNLGKVPSFIDAKADGYGVDYYMAYNPHDKHLYISTRFEHVIFRIDSRKEEFKEEDFEIYAGVRNNAGKQNGPRLEATFNTPKGMDFDSEGNLFIADSNNDAIRKITPQGIVSTYAGGEKGGHKDGTIEEAMFYRPSDVAISLEDFIYVADLANYRIRCIAVQ